MAACRPAPRSETNTPQPSSVSSSIVHYQTPNPNKETCAPGVNLGAALRPQWLSSARARSPELGAAGGHGSNKGLTGRSVQEGTAVEVQRPSGARAMGYSFIGSWYQSASGALPLCDPRPSGASGLKRASFYAFHWSAGGRGLINFKTAFERGEMRPSLRRLRLGWFYCGRLR